MRMMKMALNYANKCLFNLFGTKKRQTEQIRDKGWI